MFAQLMPNWKHGEDQQKGDCFLFVSKALALETIPTICHKLKQSLQLNGK